MGDTVLCTVAIKKLKTSGVEQHGLQFEVMEKRDTVNASVVLVELTIFSISLADLHINRLADLLQT